MKTFLIIFTVWIVLFLFSWALVHGANRQREGMKISKDDYMEDNE